VPPTDRARPAYRKLPGDFRGFVKRHTLWVGDDHLLLVDSSRMAETYKRFYLRDIQTIIIRKTPRFVLPYYWVLLAGFALILLLIGLNPFRDRLFAPAVAILAVVAVYLYIVSMFHSCTCHLITRVNKVELSSLFRIWSARRFVEAITPLIGNAQGALPANWVERSTTLEELSTAADRNPDAPVDLLPAAGFSWLVVVVFVLVLVYAGLTAVALRMNDTSSLTMANTINMIALAACATFAIVRLTRQKGSSGLRMLVLAGLFVVAAVTYCGALLQSFDQQFYHQTYKNVLQYVGMRQLGLTEIIADVAVAVPGLVLAFRQKQAPSKPVASFLDMGEPKA
jgi:hypothetical protein